MGVSAQRSVLGGSRRCQGRRETSTGTLMASRTEPFADVREGLRIWDRTGNSGPDHARGSWMVAERAARNLVPGLRAARADDGGHVWQIDRSARGVFDLVAAECR